jgi:hypothetical protein
MRVPPRFRAFRLALGSRFRREWLNRQKPVPWGLLASGRYRRLGEIASVNIGFVSGANSYFVLSEIVVRELGLPDRILIPTVDKPSDLRGLVVRPEETRLLFRPGDEESETPAVRRYLAEGVRQGIDARYKPRHRRTWYRVPLPRQVRELLLPYMSHRAPLLVGSGGARSTNLVHSVRLDDPAAIDPRVLSAWSLSSEWALSAEVEGRAYGGGVLKLETGEAERLLVPKFDTRETAELLRIFPMLDDWVRGGRRGAATAAVDEIAGTRAGDAAEAAGVFRLRRQGRGSRRNRRE